MVGRACADGWTSCNGAWPDLGPCGQEPRAYLLLRQGRQMRDMAELPPHAFTLGQAASLGLTRQELRSAQQSGVIRRVFSNVYLRADIPDTIASRATALSVVLPPWAVLCDRTAAWLHGVDALRFRELGIPPPLDVVSIRDLTPLRRAGVKGGQRDLDPLDITTVEGVRVTTPLRTALDLGCKLRRPSALATLDQFMRFDGLTLKDFEGHLPRYRRRRGVIQLRQLVRWADPRAESPGESWTRFAILDAGLPRPEAQLSILEGGHELYRLDLGYQYVRVAVEYDGREHHSSHDQHAADAARREWLASNGWTIIVVTKDDLNAESTRRWIGDLRTALGLTT